MPLLHTKRKGPFPTTVLTANLHWHVSTVAVPVLAICTKGANAPDLAISGFTATSSAARACKNELPSQQHNARMLSLEACS